MHESILLEQGTITHVSTDTIDVLCQSKVGGILARWLGDRQHRIQIPYSKEHFSPQVNQRAVFSLPAQVIVKVSAIVFFLPLLCVAVFFILAADFSLSELQSIILAAIVFIASFILSRQLILRFFKRGLLVPNLVSINNKSKEIECNISEIGIRTHSQN